MNPLERQFFPQKGLNKYLGPGSMADEYIQGGGLFGALMNYSPHLAEAKNRALPQARTATDYFGPAADMQDMKNYSAATMDELRAGNYAPALANLGMTGAAMAMTALPGNVGAVDDVVKRADFEKMASRGKVHQARATEAENIKAVQDGDAKAFKFEDIDDYEYESGDFTDRVSKTGLYIDDDMYGTVYAGKTKEDVEALKSAKTPIEYGRAAGYSEDDIATFYIARRRGDAGIAFDEYISDLKTAGPAKATTDDLPMDTASRMKRAEEMGFGDDVYHATTHEIDEFKPNRLNPESDFGAAYYFSSSPKDASNNYSIGGKDLTNRVQLQAEKYADEAEYEKGATGDVAKRYGQWRARKEIIGPHEGQVIPARLRLENPVKVGGPDETIFSIENVWDDAGEEIIEESGNGVDLIDSIRNVLYDKGLDGDKAVSEFLEKVEYLEDTPASTVDRALRETKEIMYAFDNAEDASPGQIVQEIFKRMGYDGAEVHDVATRFPGMGLEPEDVHTVVFTGHENKIRSRNAEFDPAKKDSADLLASIGGVGLLGALGLSQSDEFNERY